MNAYSELNHVEVQNLKNFLYGISENKSFDGIIDLELQD